MTALAYPPAANSQRTQITSTTPSYTKAHALLGMPDRVLDYGAGRGVGALLHGSDTLEPYPLQGFDPTYRSSSDIPSHSYPAVTCLNVLNVVEPGMRRHIVEEIVRILQPGGRAVIMTRGRDVLAAKGGSPGPEPWSLVFGTGDAAWYQKGFSPAELRLFVASIAPQHSVSTIDLGPAAVLLQSPA